MSRRIVALTGLAAIAGIGAIAVWVGTPRGPDPQPAGLPPPVASTPAGAGAPAGAPMAAALQPTPARPASGADLDRRALNAWTTGDIRAAMALFEQAIAASPDDPAPHSHYGRLLTLMVSYERAIPLLERARDLSPGDAQAWLDLATVYARAQRLDDSWAARAQASRLVGAGAITRDERGWFVVAGTSLW